MNINSLTIIATFITSIVSFGTLWSTSKQRKLAHRPAIHIKSAPFIFTEKSEWFFNNKTKPIEDYFNIGVFPAFNIGLGTAKNVEICWKLDEKMMIELVKLDKDGYFLFQHTPKESLSFKVDEEPVLMYYSGVLNQKIDFILPHNTNLDSNTFIKLPNPVIHLFTLYLELMIKRGELIKLPSLNFEVKYRDIHNIKYKKYFKVQLEIEFMFQEMTTTGELFIEET